MQIICFRDCQFVSHHIDDFERAQRSFEEAIEVNAIKEGVTLIKDKFVKSLESKGLKAIETENEVFDTELHEAITQIPAPSEDMKGKVVDCVEKGYKLGDKVIRYSKVVIGSQMNSILGIEGLQ